MMQQKQSEHEPKERHEEQYESMMGSIQENTAQPIAPPTHASHAAFANNGHGEPHGVAPVASSGMWTLLLYINTVHSFV